jgi:hypothetical protein
MGNRQKRKQKRKKIRSGTITCTLMTDCCSLIACMGAKQILGAVHHIHVSPKSYFCQ